MLTLLLLCLLGFNVLFLIGGSELATTSVTLTPEGGERGDLSVLDANYPPHVTVGRRPLRGGGGVGRG